MYFQGKHLPVFDKLLQIDDIIVIKRLSKGMIHYEIDGLKQFIFCLLMYTDFHYGLIKFRINNQHV